MDYRKRIVIFSSTVPTTVISSTRNTKHTDNEEQKQKEYTNKISVIELFFFKSNRSCILHKHSHGANFDWQLCLRICLMVITHSHKCQDEDDNMAASSEGTIKAHHILCGNTHCSMAFSCSSSIIQVWWVIYPAYALVFVFSRFHSFDCWLLFSPASGRDAFGSMANF